MSHGSGWFARKPAIVTHPSPMEEEIALSPSADVKAAIEAIQANTLYKLSVTSLFGGPLAGAFLAYVVCPVSREEEVFTVYIWLCALLASYLFRALMYRRFRLRSPQASDAGVWLTRFAIATAVSGCLFGSAGVLLFVSNSVMHQTLLVTVLLGMCAVALGLHGSHLPSFFAFVLPAGAPVTIRLLTKGDVEHFTLACFAGLFYLLVILMGRYWNRMLVASFRLRCELDEKKAIAEQATQEAEQANREKSRFLAAASHDLRQPLHALGLLTSALRYRIIQGEERDILLKIERSVDALDSLFNALLDLSKLDAGIIKPNIEVVSVQSLLSKLEADLSHEAGDKGLRLRITRSRSSVKSDAVLLERILRNLISNAIRYTNRGSIFVCCRRRGDRIRIEVRDSGIGIPETEQVGIFEEFYQLDNPERDRNKGLGLGLAIVKRLSALLGHSIHLRSRPGGGSTFAIDVPLLQEPVSAEIDYVRDVQGEDNLDLEGAFVLVVDDETDVLQGTRLLLEGWGCHVVMAGSGDEALQTLGDHIRHPDVIISDYRLRNGETGLDVIRQVQARVEVAIPGILVTGDFKQVSNDEAATCEFSVLFKPVPPYFLRQALTKALRPDRQGHTHS